MGVLSAFSGHGSFSGGVAVMLCVYGLGLVGVAWALWRLRLFSRGPVVGAALLHLAVIVSGYLTGPYLWISILASAVPVLTLVAVLWPSSTRALQNRRVAAQSDLENKLSGTDDPKRDL